MRVCLSHTQTYTSCAQQDVDGLCAALAANTVLTELSCSCHPLSAAAAARFGDALAANATLRSISVGDSSFGDAGLAAMAAGLAANSGLTSLDLEQKGLGAAGARALRACLEAHPALERVTLARNAALGADGAAELCGVEWRALRRLDLSDCALDAAAAAALAAAPSLGRLEELALAGNGGLGAAAGAPLAALLARADALRSLDLRGARLGAEGAAALAAALPSVAPKLVALDLGECRLGANGCAALAAAVRADGGAVGGRLRRLVLGPKNDLEAADVAALAAALAEAHAETGSSGSGSGSSGGGLELDLSGAEVDAAAVRALAGIPGLASLSLFGATLDSGGDGNGGSGGGALEAIAAALSARAGGGGGSETLAPFAALRELNLSGCRLGAADLLRLLAAVEAAPADGGGALRLVEVGANPGADDEGFQEAAAALRERRPGVDVHFRAGDGSGEGSGGPGGAMGQPPLRALQPELP